MTVKSLVLHSDAPESKRRGRPTKAQAEAKHLAKKAVVLLAGLDACNFSSQGRVSGEVYVKLREAKEAAKLAEQSGSVHCPEWLGAQVKPKGDRGGGYPY